MTYKLFERLIYNININVILDKISIEQAEFRPDRKCTDQLVSLITFIEAEFQSVRLLLRSVSCISYSVETRPDFPISACNTLLEAV